MPTLPIDLTDSQAAYAEHMVAAGRYSNASEVLRDALRQMQRREAQEDARLAAWRALVQAGADDIAAGRYEELTDEQDTERFVQGVLAESARGA